MAFTLFQAGEMPMMSLGETMAERVGGDVWRVWVDITNDRIAPTITARAAENHVVPPDLLHLEGAAEIISAGWVRNKHAPGATDMIDQVDLERIIVRNGHPGRTTRTIEYIVRGSGALDLRYESMKGGTVQTRINLR
jgi:hypothetical protein